MTKHIIASGGIFYELEKWEKKMMSEASIWQDLSDIRLLKTFLDNVIPEYKVGIKVPLRLKKRKSIKRKSDIDSRTINPHSSYYIPPYFSVFGSNRPFAEPCIHSLKCKVRKNMRPKATHTNRKFYR